MATYAGKISGMNNEITADDLATLRNFIIGWEHGVLNIDGCNFKAEKKDSTTVTIQKGIMFAYGYFGYLPESITIPFIKPAATQYRFIYGELDRSVTPNTFKIKVKNNQSSKKILETTFRQDYLSAIKTGIFQLPLWRIELNSNGIADIDGIYDVRELVDYIKQSHKSSSTHIVTGTIDSTVIVNKYYASVGECSNHIANCQFVHKVIEAYIQGGNDMTIQLVIDNTTSETVTVSQMYFPFITESEVGNTIYVKVTCPTTVSVALGKTNTLAKETIEFGTDVTVETSGTQKTITFPLIILEYQSGTAEITIKVV